MRITYTASEADFIYAGYLILRKKSGIPIRFLMWLGAAFLLVVLFGILGFKSSLALNLLPLAGLFGVLFIVLPLVARWNMSKQYRSNPILSELRSLQADFSGIHVRSESASGDIAWANYAAFAEDEHSFLLIQQGNQIFVPIPKRELSLDQIDEVRSTFETYLPRK